MAQRWSAGSHPSQLLLDNTYLDNVYEALNGSWRAFRGPKGGVSHSRFVREFRHPCRDQGVGA
jgi:hypothetical protein